MFTSGWGNQNQNQQQQQQQPQQQQPQPGAFGQPNAFGTNTGTSGFGATAFGQQQPQQPQVNPMFGNLQNPAPSGQSGGFGAFNNPSTTSAFGQPKPTTGFSAFSGGTSAFGSTPTTFGQTANTGTSIFGQPSTSTTGATFGSTSAFGAGKPAASVFGSTPTAPTVNNGTGHTPYSPFNEKDANIMLQYQTITCIPAYRGFSLEELRLQDYAQNRKTASTSAFGTGPTFGTTQPAATTATSTGIFGSQNNQPAQNSIFGGGQTNTTGTGGFGTFGQAGQPSTTQPATGIFGGSTAFGQQQQQQQQQQPQPQPQQASPFGTFGQQNPPQQQQTGGIFGGSGFGSTANKATFGTTSAFANQPSTNAFGTQTAFGQTPQPPQQTGLFGNTQPNNQNPLGAFGTANTQNKSLFGTTTTTQPTTTGTFGIFGGQNQPNQQGQQQPAQPTSIFGTTGGTGVFGTTTNQQPQQNPAQPATSLFGTQTNASGTSLFGNSGGGIFGNTGAQQQQQQQQQQQSSGAQQPAQINTFGNLFGPKPGGTFPSVNTAVMQPQTGLFQQSNLFGQRPTAPQLGISTSGQTGGLFTSGLGASTNILGTSTAVQPSLTASIAEPIDTSVNIFSMIHPPGPRILDLDQSQQKKKQGFFVDVPTRSPLPRQMGYTPASSKLRGFGSSTIGSVNGLISTNSLSFTSGKPNALSLNGSTGSDGILARSSSPALGSGSRQSVKKVILDKKVEPSELFLKSGSPNSTRGGKITFSPALSMAAREKDAARPHSPAAGQLESPVPTSKNPPRSLSRFTAEPPPASATEATADTTLQEGDYYIRPPLATLKKASYDELSSFVGLVVGRVGYGEIHFLEPVDLTGLSKLGALLGDVVRFDDKECSVYPDSEDVDKPPPGSGLNVKARLILERCWVTDKATREPIKDTSHPSAVKHLKRLKNMKDTRFEGFEMDSGKWTFTVDHF